MKRIIIIALLSLIVVAPAMSARAQAAPITVINGTMPISAELRQNLEIYLNSNPPVNVPYYAVTYFDIYGDGYLVSLAGLDLSSPDEDWSLEAGDDGAPVKVKWVGTILIHADGSGEPYSTDPPLSGFAPHLALPAIGAGGGGYVIFPWQGGASMMYGPRRIHGAGDYGTSGMYAVDYVGGDSLGTNVARDIVFASDSGTVDYVCSDDTSVAVRTHNSSTGDYFLYAHLLDNANLTNGHVFSQGSSIGSLKHGTFNDTCGWAEQSANVYHVHWMFVPSNGSFQIGDCVLLFSDKSFHCGNKVISAGGWLINNGATGGVDDPNGIDGSSGGITAPSFWDGIMTAASVAVFNIANQLPEHNSPTALLRSILNTITLFYRLVWVLVRGNLNLTPIVVLAYIFFVYRAVFAGIWLILWAWMALKAILI